MGHTLTAESLDAKQKQKNQANNNQIQLSQRL
jgi:hypothetical protein